MPDDDEGRLLREPSGAGTAWMVVLAGLLGASLAAAGVQPEGQLSANKILVIAALWVGVTAGTGTGALLLANMVLRRREGRRFRVEALEAMAAWLLLPPLFLLADRGSAWAMALAAGAAAVLAACLRGMIPAAGPLDGDEMPAEGLRFAELPRPDSGRGQAWAVAICVEGAVVLAARRQAAPAALLMGVGAFVLVWKRLTSLQRARGETMRRPASRSAAAAVLALVVVVPLLLVQLVRMGPAGVASAAEQASPKQKAQDADAPADGYRGIVLFAVRDKAKELPPVPVERPAVWNGARRPLVIPFDGAYWYFQAPHRDPGLHPHVAEGDPVKVSIFSTGWLPLEMEAHQALARPVAVRDCGALVVRVRNGDNRPGRIEMGVVLTDEALAAKPSLFLGTEPIVSTEAGSFVRKASPVEEDVRFRIPEGAGMREGGKLREFDAITVLFFPAGERATMGSRVGIEDFSLEPR